MSGILTGLKAWVVQRASAVYLLAFVLLMPIAMICQEVNNFAAWQAFIYSPIVTTTWLLFFISLFAHAWIGIRDVILDYIHPFKFRVLLLSVVAIYLFAMMFWTLRILLYSKGVSA